MLNVNEHPLHLRNKSHETSTGIGTWIAAYSCELLPSLNACHRDWISESQDFRLPEPEDDSFVNRGTT